MAGRALNNTGLKLHTEFLGHSAFRKWGVVRVQNTLGIASLTAIYMEL